MTWLSCISETIRALCLKKESSTVLHISNHLGGLDGHGHFIRIRALCKVIRNYLEKLKIHVYEYFIYCLIV